MTAQQEYIRTTLDMLNELAHVVLTTETGMLNGKKHEFNMYVWGTKNHCGTAGCALGSYAFSALGQARGITLVMATSALGQALNGYARLAFNGHASEMYEDTLGMAAGSFGITAKEALYLFDPDAYMHAQDENGDVEPITQREVLEHIAAVRAKYEKKLSDLGTVNEVTP